MDYNRGLRGLLGKWITRIGIEHNEVQSFFKAVNRGLRGLLGKWITRIGIEHNEVQSFFKAVIRVIITMNLRS
jgi:uncharacterized membrane protein